MTNRNRLFLVCLGMIALPPFLAAAFECVRAPLRKYPIGDWALLESGVHEAARGRLLLGPYSRFGWHHPGPLLEYVLVPGYWLGGRSTASLHVSAALLSLVSLLVLAYAWKRVASLEQLRWFIVLLAATCVSFALGWDRSAHAETWNPMVAFMPFTVVLVSSVAATSGAPQILPLTFFFHALASQSHIEYALPATGAAALAVGTLLVRRSRGEGDRIPGRVWALTLLVVVVLWSPTLWEAASTGRGGNIGRIIRFFVENRGGVASRDGARWGTAVLVFCSPLPKVLEVLGAGRSAQVLLCGLLLVGLGASIVVSHVLLRRRCLADPLSRSLLVATEAQVLLALLAVWQLPGHPYWYVLLWLNAVFFLACLTITTIAIARFPKLATLTSSQEGAFTTALLIALASVPQVRRIVQYRPDAVTRNSVRVATDALIRLEERTGVSAPFIELLGPNAWSWGAGVALQLLERGRVPVLRSAERDRFGSAFSYTDDPRIATRLPTVSVAAREVGHRRSVAPLAQGFVSVDAGLDFGKTWARPFLEGGWGEDERVGSRSFVWTRERNAQVRVGLFPGLGYHLRFAVEPAGMPERVQGMDVLVNGLFLRRIELLPSLHEYELEVPSTLVKASTTVEFRFDADLSPVDPSGGEDPRPRFAAFDFLRFEALLPDDPGARQSPLTGD